MKFFHLYAQCKNTSLRIKSIETGLGIKVSRMIEKNGTADVSGVIVFEKSFRLESLTAKNSEKMRIACGFHIVERVLQNLYV